MKKIKTKQNPEFLSYVYHLTQKQDVYEALEQSLKQLNEVDIDVLKNIGFKTYEKGKWTVYQILQHLIDWERIWCFRAVIFARQEGSIPEAHDQVKMCQNSNANNLTVNQLINELLIVRQASMALFNSFDKKILKINCKFFEYQMPLEAIGLTIVAHQIHHLNVIKERYFPLSN